MVDIRRNDIQNKEGCFIASLYLIYFFALFHMENILVIYRKEFYYMPSDKNKQQSSPRVPALKRIISAMQGNLDDLYRSTYYADKENNKQLQDIRADIDNSIKSIIDSNADTVGEPNISKLYERLLMGEQSNKDTITEFERIFGDNEFVNNLANSYMDNRWVKAVDMEIDEILRYMPKLHEALLTIRDNVLSADSFSKDYLNIELDSPSPDSSEQFSHNIQELKQKYNLLKLTSEIYDDTSKYGEVFIYCVPYQKAIQRLIDRKHIMKNVVVKTNYHENTIVIEDSLSGVESTIIKNTQGQFKEGEDDYNYNIQIESGVISSIVNDERNARDLFKNRDKSLTEQFFIEQGLSEGIVDVRSDI